MELESHSTVGIVFQLHIHCLNGQEKTYHPALRTTGKKFREGKNARTTGNKNEDTTFITKIRVVNQSSVSIINWSVLRRMSNSCWYFRYWTGIDETLSGQQRMLLMTISFLNSHFMDLCNQKRTSYFLCLSKNYNFQMHLQKYKPANDRKKCVRGGDEQKQ